MSGPEPSADILREHAERCTLRSLIGIPTSHIMYFLFFEKLFAGLLDWLVEPFVLSDYKSFLDFHQAFLQNLAATLKSMTTRSLEFRKHWSLSNTPQSRNFGNPCSSEHFVDDNIFKFSIFQFSIFFNSNWILLITSRASVSTCFSVFAGNWKIILFSNIKSSNIMQSFSSSLKVLFHFAFLSQL